MIHCFDDVHVHVCGEKMKTNRHKAEYFFTAFDDKCDSFDIKHFGIDFKEWKMRN